MSKSNLKTPMSEINKSTDNFTPIYIYISMCLLISLFQMTYLYFTLGLLPNLSSTASNFCMLLLCSCVLYMLSGLNSGIAYGCAFLLIIYMITSCVLIIINSQISKYFSMNYYIDLLINSTTNTTNTNDPSSESINVNNTTSEQTAPIIN